MKHILVVEDDAVNALLFRMILEKRGGHRVTVTESPAEILAIVRGGLVDLVIMDISLSHSRHEGQAVNGVDLCRLLKADPQCAATPVVLATAHAMRGDGESLLRESGADDYVAKPIVDHAMFMDQIQRHLRAAA
jgi:two-component system, cell cycle response regulator DivK